MQHATQSISTSVSIESQLMLKTQQLKQHFVSGVTRSLDWRRQQLKSLQSLLESEERVLLDALQADLGKGDYEGWVTEIGFVKGEIGLALKKLDKWAAPRKVGTPMVAQPAKSFLLPEPLGTVLIIGAWNYPVQLVLGPLVAAIAAGNCAVIKPSELAAKTSSLLATLLPKYLDKDAFAVVEGAVEETTALLKQEFDHIMYTGGEGVAKIVMRAAAEHLTPVTLELGGKSPCIVDSNMNLKTVASRIIWGKWSNSGQTCVAPDYVIVEKKNRDALVAAIKARLQEFYGDEPSKSKDYGRIINARHHARLVSYLDDQTVAFGGDYDTETRYFSPTVLLDPSLDSPVMQEEVFGPILPIISVDNMDAAIDIVNARSKPLALYVYTKDKDYEKKVLLNTSAGSVAVNDAMMFMANPKLPFGGVGNSGMGSYHGQFGFDTFSHLKAVMKRGMLLDPNLRYPPFTDGKLSIMKKML